MRTYLSLTNYIFEWSLSEESEIETPNITIIYFSFLYFYFQA